MQFQSPANAKFCKVKFTILMGKKNKGIKIKLQEYENDKST